MITFDQSYIDDNRTRMFICFSINTVAVIIGVFLVIKASPKHMGIYKYFLLDIIFWSYVMDFVTTLLWMPLPAMPAPSICISGLMKDLGNYNGNSLCFVIFIIAFGGCGAACNFAIFFRLFAVRAQHLDFFAKKNMIILITVIHCVNTIPVIGSFYYAMNAAEDTFEDLRNYHIREYPFMDKLVFLVPCGVIQAMLPVFCLGLPYAVIIAEIILTDKTLADLSILLLTVGALHSFFHTVVLATVIKPYRDIIFKTRIKIILPGSQNPTHHVPQLSTRTLRSSNAGI
ncbi:hypothetical protein FO519_004355 [Halicephalobus sp. NKZ332]|nr:hypothetical protein FO519_004355 [Halicephalobus sp. NKZ332]